MKLIYTDGVKTGKITMNQMVATCCTNPAQIFGMYPKKGLIAPGADADVVIWQPEGEGTISAKTHRHKVDTSIFEGFATIGGPSIVIADGKVQFEDGQLNVEPGAGKYIPRTLNLR